MPSSKTPAVLVTIEGSLTPCWEVPRGESRTVMLTSHIQHLIDRGYVTVTHRSEIKPAPPRKATKAILSRFTPPVAEPDVNLEESESA